MIFAAFKSASSLGNSFKKNTQDFLLSWEKTDLVTIKEEDNFNYCKFSFAFCGSFNMFSNYVCQPLYCSQTFPIF